MGEIKVNGVEIPVEAIDSEVQFHKSDNLDEARAAATRALVIRELLLQAAEEKGIKVVRPKKMGEPAPGSEEAIEKLLEIEIPKPEISEEKCKHFYDTNKKRFKSPALFEACHILFAASPDDDDAFKDAFTQAEAVLELLKLKPERFPELATAHSACPSNKEGGNLGQVAPGDTVPEFESFLFSLEEGQLCPVPVKTRFGVHIIRLDKKINARALPFDEVKEHVAGFVTRQTWQQGVHKLIQDLALKADLVGISILGDDGPMVMDDDTVH
jgi:peptidyl-prolyl cis-trans isomerase C